MESWISAVIQYDSGIKEKTRGIQVSENLVLINNRSDNSWTIHHIRSGRKIVQVAFTYKAALEVSRFLDPIYGDYEHGNLFELLSEFPQYPLLQLAQYSVPSGEDIYSGFKELEMKEQKIFDVYDVKGIIA